MELTDSKGCGTLNNGVKIPYLGLGTFETDDKTAKASVEEALEAGYRHVDTAAMYRNEKGVGQGVNNNPVPREEVFVTSKVWNSDQGYEQTLKAFDSSLKKLDFDYLDLYLIHWPVPDKFKDTWKALEKLYEDGLIRAIGVSNFTGNHLEDLLADANVVPAVNQVEFHPRLIQQDLRDFCNRHNIRYEAWSPLMKGEILRHPIIVNIAGKHRKTPAQVVIRWDLQKDVISIPKSKTPERIRENADVFDFSLSEEEMQEIDALDQNARIGPDPNLISF